jgi:hypothetical protein
LAKVIQYLCDPSGSIKLNFFVVIPERTKETFRVTDNDIVDLEDLTQFDSRWNLLTSLEQINNVTKIQKNHAISILYYSIK